MLDSCFFGHLSNHLTVKGFHADKNLDRGIPKIIGELLLPVHGIQGDNYSTTLPDAKLADDKLWNILKIKGHAVSFFYTKVFQGAGKGIAHLIQFFVRDDLIEIVKSGLIAMQPDCFSEVL